MLGEEVSADCVGCKWTISATEIKSGQLTLFALLLKLIKVYY